MKESENSSELDVTIAEVKEGFKYFLVRRKELIVKLGTAYEKVVADPESICEEIKNVLRDEIAQKLISSRDIERYCLDKWKKKTKPRNDKLSFSNPVEEKLQSQVAVTHNGKSVKLDAPEDTVTSERRTEGIGQADYGILQDSQNGTQGGEKGKCYKSTSN